jgi:hypothetical protein
MASDFFTTINAHTTMTNIVDTFNEVYTSTNGDLEEVQNQIIDESHSDNYEPLPNEQLYVFIERFKPCKSITYDDLFPFIACLGTMFKARYDITKDDVNGEDPEMITLMFNMAIASNPPNSSIAKKLKKSMNSDTDIEELMEMYDNNLSNVAYRDGGYESGDNNGDDEPRDVPQGVNIVTIFNGLYKLTKGDLREVLDGLSEKYFSDADAAFKPLPNEQLYEFIRGFKPCKPMTYEDVNNFFGCLGGMFLGKYTIKEGNGKGSDPEMVNLVFDVAIGSYERYLNVVREADKISQCLVADSSSESQKIQTMHEKIVASLDQLKADRKILEESRNNPDCIEGFMEEYDHRMEIREYGPDGYYGSDDERDEA